MEDEVRRLKGRTLWFEQYVFFQCALKPSLRDHGLLDHPFQDGPLPLLYLFHIMIRIEPVGGIRDGGQECGLRQCQICRGYSKVGFGCAFYAIQIAAHRKSIHILFKNCVLVHSCFYSIGLVHLLQFLQKRSLAGVDEPCQLKRDGRCPGDDSLSPEVLIHGPKHGHMVDAIVAKEVLVLRSDNGVQEIG